MRRRRLLAAAALVPMAGSAHSQARASEPGVTAREIVLGQTADLSASRAVITKAYSAGASLHFDAVNSNGGVHGRKIRVVQRDDGYLSDKALDNARELVERSRVFALVHTVGTGITERLLPYVEGQGVPHVHPLTGADHLRPPARPGRSTFFLRASYNREVERIVGHLHTLGMRRIAMVHEDEPFGQTIRSAVEASMRDHGSAVAAIGVLPFNQSGAAGISQAVATVAKASPVAVIVGSAGPSVEQFIQQYRDGGNHTQFYCLSVCNVEKLHKALGPLSRGVVVSQVMPAVQSSNLPVARDYRQLVETKSGTPTAFGLEGYISARLIVDALRIAGPELSRARFLNGLVQATAGQVGGFPVRYRDDPREGSPFVELAMVGPEGKLIR